MAQNICNICGANYEYKNGRWICPACGAYKPEELSNEEVTLLYNASQKIRLALFDDAEEQYKDITSKYPDNPDGYWGLVLAKYGIKYEQDYDGKMIPSCYAASYESVLTDKNYLKAVELADKDNKKYYEEQANKIEKIRKEWIDKASKEEPYDIFISYKDTEKENGTERTKDSYDALELYTMLSKLGYRVFYSRESLKDKTGEKYEPYIFNALNTAHIMIVYGSKPEYIESTWIKNEWMRFYKRIKLGKKQPNALLVINNGFNPAELPSPLSKMQTLDRNRLDFSRELESYCKRVIKAATTVLPKIERVEVKAKQGKVGKIVKIEAVELNNKTVQKTEIVREEVEKREIGNYTVSKLTANAENELKIAEMQLSTANFDEAGKRFNTFLLKNPKNGRALTGKLLAENKSKDLDGFSSAGVQNFADWKLLEQVLLFSEKSVSEKILKALCDEILRSFSAGDYVRARDVYSQVSAYEDSAVTEMRKSVCDLAKGLIGKNDDTAKYFIDGYLLYEQDEDKFLSQIRNIVGNSIEKSDFGFAKKYSEDWLKYENYDLSANYSALKIKYKVKTLTELFAKTENDNAYSEIDDILHCLNEESAAACFKDICDRVNTLLSADNFAKQVYAYIDKFFQYNINGRSEKIKQFLIFIANKPSKEFASVFDLLLSLSDFSTEEYSLYTLRFADAALKNGDFDLADKYYDKVNELHETALSWEGKLKCRLKVRNDIEYSANMQNLTDFKIIENILSLSENDGKRYEFLSRIVGYVYSALKTSKTDAAKLVAVFENLLAYVPKDFDDKIIEWLFKFARFLKDKGEFDLAEKLYATIVNYDAENHVAYWEMLQAKLRCKDENAVIKQYNLISDFQEFQNALLASANNDSALRHYIDIQNKQKAWIEQDKLNKIKAKKRKKVFKVACIMFAVVIIAVAGVFGGLTYYNSENILKYNSVDDGLSVYAGKFYKAEGTLVIPQTVDGKTVTEIGANAFENHTEIKKVVIPTTVNAIRESAFSGCVNLESVEFNNISEASANTQANANENNGISLFSAQTFNAINFATANATDSIKLSVIGAKAFKGCEKLQTFELNYGLKTIGEEAFSGSGLKEIAIPETVEYVGKNVFENCNSLTVIEVGDRDEIPQNWDTDWNKGQEVKVEFSVRVVFDYNGADRTIKTEQYVVYEKSYNFPVPTKEGYTFDGWYRGETKLTGKDGSSLSDWNYTGGGTVKAEFTANENTLFFNGNGATSGDMQSQKIHTADNANLNINGFTRAGYTFIGWATSANGTKVYNDGALYTMGKNSSYVLYAVWQANTNTLHFDANGGNGAMADKNINTDSTTTLSANTFTRNGYTFVGWSTTANGTKAYNDNASYTMGTNEEYTLYALWTTVSYSINYNLNEGVIASANPTTYNVETEAFTLNNPTRNGYTFTGWSGTDIVSISELVMLEKGSVGNRTYTANWEANMNTLHFNANGGTGEMADMQIATDSTVLLSATAFTRKGYSFIGWAISVSGEKLYNDNAMYTMGTGAEYTLYAVWSINTYSITCELNNGTLDIPNQNEFTVETDTFTINNPTRAGYIFTGWSGTDINGQSMIVTIAKGSIGDREYTANWEANINVLHFNANGGTGEMDDMLIATDNTATLSPNTFTRKGYTFVGWSTTANGTKAYNDNASYTMGTNSEYTLYAVWSLDTYSISYNLNGGSASGNPANYNVNTATFTLNSPTRKGYNFIGWSGTDITDNSLVVTIAQGSVGNCAYTANWSIITYDISYNLDGGTVSGNPTSYTVATNTFTLNNPTKTGYNFVGWRGTDISGTSSSVSISKGSIGNRSYTANWQIIEYTVSYSLAGGLANGNTTSYTVEDSFTLINPTRAGYTFIGWSGTDIDGTLVNVTVAKGSIGNRSYAANWEANQNVIILTDGNKNVQVTGYTDDYVRLPQNTFKKSNNEFKGWATTQNGEVEYYDRDLYPVGPNSSYTLYAVWEETEIIDRTGWIPISTVEELNNIRNNLSGKYYLTSDLDMFGYEWTPIGEYYHERYYKTTKDESFKGIFDGNGYIIYNFNSKSNLVSRIRQNSYSYYSLTKGCGLFGLNKGTIKNVTIYGATIEYSLSLSSNTYNINSLGEYYVKIGIISAMNWGTINNCYAYGSITFSSNFAITSNSSLTYGYNYLCGVNIGGICGEQNGVINCSANVSITSNRNCVLGYVVPDTENINSLTAQNTSPWNDWYIKYVCQNGTYRYQFAKWHSYVNALEPFETKAGYTFIGWAISDGGAVKYHAGDECFIPLDKTSLTLYPVWQANTNEVIFNANGGSGEMTNQQIQTDATAKLSANVFTKTGYHFIGWSTSPDGQVEFTDKADYTIGVNSYYTLYAVWGQNTNEIIFNANGGSGTMANQQALTNTVVTINQCMFTAPMGYYFAGWSEDPNGSADYTDGALFSVGTNSVYNLYAIWNKIYTSSDYFTFVLQDDDTYAITSVSDNIPNDVIIPEEYNGKSVSSISKNAFKEHETVKTVIIPGSVKSIGDSAFYHCSNLTSVTIENGVKIIKNDVFAVCSSLSSVIIGNEVTSIGYVAFNSCISLSSIVIPESVTDIKYDAFANCSCLTEIRVSDNNNCYKSIDGNLYSKDGKTLIKYAIGKTATEFTIPDSVTSIGESAFAYCICLTSITIPDSVINIGNSAFTGCSNLSNVIFCENSQLTRIGNYAFRLCNKGLTSITIPESVTSIGNYAFYGCSKLTSVTFKNYNGWTYTSSALSTNGASISSAELSNQTTAATYLKSTYVDYYWNRT